MRKEKRNSNVTLYKKRPKKTIAHQINAQLKLKVEGGFLYPGLGFSSLYLFFFFLFSPSFLSFPFVLSSQY